jgi:2',3'-cyclic-nucleotide 2'-phosphodiesterase (5'-nucleotidase family)
MIRLLWILLIGAGLIACSSVNTFSVSTNQYPISSDYQDLNSIDSMISPYRDSLDAEMLEVIGRATKNFEKARPNGPLNNWAADAILNSQRIEDQNNPPIMCLLNYGGLRNPISAGDVTVGEVYKLMPFDNLIVWVKMPISSKTEIEAYLSASGGEPIAGATIKNGELIFANSGSEIDYFWVITSDYLLNGGDHMDFFEQRIDEKLTNMLLRDAMMESVKKQGTLVFSDETRISF